MVGVTKISAKIDMHVSIAEKGKLGALNMQ
jgi:hypothetical protein